MTQNKIALIALAMTTTLLLNGCGGSDNTTQSTTQIDIPSTNDETGSSIDVTVIDGYIQGAHAFADLNLNGVQDEDEPSGTTTVGGKVTLVGAADIDLENAVIVVNIPEGAIDEDTITTENPAGIPITKEEAYQLVSLPGETIVTPLTTLVSMTAAINAIGEVNAEDIQAAKETVANSLDFTKEEISADYLESDNDALADLASLMIENEIIPKLVAENISSTDLLIASVVTKKIAEVIIKDNTDGNPNNAVIEAIAEAVTLATKGFVEAYKQSITTDNIENFTTVVDAISNTSVKAFDEHLSSEENITVAQLESSQLYAQVASTVISELLIKEVESELLTKPNTVQVAIQTIEVIKASVIDQIIENTNNEKTNNLSISEITEIAVLTGQFATEYVEELLAETLDEQQFQERFADLEKEIRHTSDTLSEEFRNTEETSVFDDLDGDGIANTEDDDDDGDGYTDTDEIAANSDPLDKSDMPVDTDGDKVSDATDTDIDGDGILNTNDAFTHNANESLDTDGDGVGNNTDSDDDDDGYLDVDELTANSDPLSAVSLPSDLDGDYISDSTDTDIDGDGFNNDIDEFPVDVNSWITLENINFTDQNLANCILKDYSENTPNNDIIDTSCSKNNIVDLSGIENLTSLESIDFSQNQLTSISALTEIANLTALDISGNPITNFDDVALLSSLTSISIEGQEQLDSLSSLLPLPSLTELKVDYVTNISAIPQFTSLTALSVTQSPNIDLNVIAGLTDLTYLDLQGNDFTDISALKDLTALTYLNLIYNDFTDITVLENLTSLTYLSVKTAPITDISALANLTSLTELYFTAKDVDDYSPLVGISSLRKLSIFWGQDTSYDVLANLTSLEKLVLYGDAYTNNAVDFNFLSKLNSLKTLYIIGGIADTSLLSKLTTLETLLITSANMPNINFLSDLKSLTSLDLRYSEITNLNALENLQNLVSLHLYSNEINDISSLANLTALQSLELSSNQISDISALSNLTNLESVILYDNLISDISPLTNLAKLTELNLKNNNITDITPLSGLINLSTLNLKENEISDISTLLNLPLLQELFIYSQSIQNLSLLLELPTLDYVYNENNDNLLTLDTDSDLLLDILDSDDDNDGIDDTEDLAPLDVTSWTTIGNITFTDENLAACITEQNHSDTLNGLLTLLICDNRGIEDLSGIENLPQLTHLNIFNNNINDLSTLVSLTKLEAMVITPGNVEDLTIVEDITSLTHLYYDEYAEVNILADAVFHGDLSAEIPKNVSSISGSIWIEDTDTGENTLKITNEYFYIYGDMEVSNDGAWTFTLDINNEEVLALNEDETIILTYPIQSVDESEQDITITISGY